MKTDSLGQHFGITALANALAVNMIRFVMQVNPDARYQRRHSSAAELSSVHGAHIRHCLEARNLLFATVKISLKVRWNAVANHLMLPIGGFCI